MPQIHWVHIYIYNPLSFSNGLVIKELSYIGCNHENMTLQHMLGSGNV